MAERFGLREQAHRIMDAVLSTDFEGDAVTLNPRNVDTNILACADANFPATPNIEKIKMTARTIWGSLFFRNEQTEYDTDLINLVDSD